MKEQDLKKLTLDCFFNYILENFAPNKSVSYVNEEPITYEELGRKVKILSMFLHERGIRKGDKVIILGDNSPNWAVAFLAVTTMGAVAVPVLSEFPESDINHIIAHSEANAAFVDEKILTSLDLTALEKVPEVISLTSFYLVKETAPQEENFLDKISNIPEKVGEAIKSGRNLFRTTGGEIGENDLAEILYTSGTTGHSKGVMLTHKNLVTNALAGPDALGGVTTDSVMLTLLPLAHAYGCTTAFMGAISCGASLYFLSRKPSPKVLMDAMAVVRPTLVTGVPMVFEKIYHKKVLPEITTRKALRFLTRFDLSRRLLYRKIGQKVLESFGGRLHSFIIGGASLNGEVELFLREGKIPYAIGYGLSECAPIVSGDSHHHLKPGSVGRAIKGVQIKIDNPDKKTAVGEVWVRGPNVMRGYYKNDDETKKVLLKDGWLRTGDLGYLDSDGSLFIKGRSKNVYVGASGENIYPEIIEDKLRESLFVEEALAYVENDRVVARIYMDYDYIQTLLDAPKHTIRHEEIDEILEKVRTETNSRLPAFSQIGRLLEQPEPFEKTPTNKIKRVLYVPDYRQK